MLLKRKVYLICEIMFLSGELRRVLRELQKHIDNIVVTCNDIIPTTTGRTCYLGQHSLWCRRSTKIENKKNI